VAEGDLQGKVAIITGGGGAIGSATAERLARAGAAVAIADIREKAAAKVADRLTAEGLAVRAFAVDLSSEAEIRALVDGAVQAFGRIDILHNNAVALLATFEADGMLVDLTAEVWDGAFAVNVRAPMLLAKYVIPHMLRQGDGGVIINTSSGASEAPSADSRAAYGSSKAALNTLTRYIAAQYGAQNIRCNAILPGAVLTRGMEKIFGAEQLDAMAGRTMLRRVSLPEDIAALVHFLVSDAARQITGELVRIDGGRP
jgi:NAD(P)-dependent dehydrogenase (short-subunit alcohol dehydrogenase family)